jgi:hypothetical protein
MISVMLASWLLTQHWQWEKSATATSYRIYWGASGTAWCAANRVEIPATNCGIAAGCDDDTKCCGDIPMPDFTPAHIVVTAVNNFGEGPTDHGPVVVCP